MTDHTEVLADLRNAVQYQRAAINALHSASNHGALVNHAVMALLLRAVDIERDALVLAGAIERDAAK